MNRPSLHTHGLRRRLLLLGAAGSSAMLVTRLAQAHGPTPQRIDESIDVAVAPAKAWALIGNFAGVASWNPTFSASEADKGNTAGSRRVLTLARGGQISEGLDEHSDTEMSMSWRSARDLDPAVLPASSYSARLRVLAAGSGSRIEFRARAYRADTGNDPAKGRDDAAVVQALQSQVRAGLARAKALLEQGG